LRLEKTKQKIKIMGGICSTPGGNDGMPDGYRSKPTGKFVGGKINLDEDGMKSNKTIDFSSSAQHAATVATERKKIAEQVERKVRENREHRNVVVGENSDDLRVRSVVIPHNKKEPKDVELIMKALRLHFLFGSLRPNEMKVVALAMSEEEVEDGTAVITQGERGKKADKFYIVKEGSFDILVDGSKVLSQGPGDTFGELALMYNAPRAATCIASEDSVVYTLNRLLFKHLLIEASNKQAAKRLQFLKEVRIVTLYVSLTHVHTHTHTYTHLFRYHC